MKKTSLADQIEQKIRQLKDRYKHLKNTSSENILRQSSIPKNPVNEMIRQDLKTHLPILKLQSSRDVSHLQKNRSPKTQVSPSSFPTDLGKLRKILEFQGLLNESPSSVCLKAASSEHHSKKLSDIDEQTIELLQRLDHGFPSSRKEAENLMNWFLEMKNKYENDENFDSVIIFSEQELVKHVLAECKTRGNLLKMIFAHYHSAAIRAKERSDEKIQEVFNAGQKKHEKYEKRIEDLGHKLHGKGIEIANLVKKHEEIVRNLQEDVGFFKKKLQDIQKLYLEEQELWKKQWLNVSQRKNHHNLVIFNSSYNLAVTRLRPDLFPSEPVFPEELKKKIESGEALDVSELQKYRDEYLKFQQDQNEVQFVDVEVQTEETKPDGSETSYYSNRSSVANGELLLPTLPKPDQLVVNDEKLVLVSGDLREPDKNLQIVQEENKTADKEIQTEAFEAFNDSEMDEIQNFLENEFIEEFAENSEEENNEESYLRSTQNSWIAALIGKKKQNNSEKFDEYLKKQDPNFEFKSPILQNELPVLVEGNSSLILQNEVSEKKPQPKDINLKLKPEARRSSLHVNFTSIEEEKIRAKSRGDQPDEKTPEKSSNLKKGKAQSMTPKPGPIGTPKVLSQVASPTPQHFSGGTSPKNLVSSNSSKNLSFTEASEMSAKPEILTKVVSSKDLKEKINLSIKKSQAPEQNSRVVKQNTLTKIQSLTEISEDNAGESSDSNVSISISNQGNSSSKPRKKQETKISRVSEGKLAQNSFSPEILQTKDDQNISKETLKDKSNERASQPLDSSKELSRKNSEKHSNRKRDSYIINIKAASERRGSVPLVLSGPQILKEIRDPAVPNQLKLATLSLLKNIQVKKKELADIERQLEEKKKKLNESSSDSSSSESSSMDHISPNKRRMSTADVLHKVLKRLSLKPDESLEDKRRKSASHDLIKSLITEELKKRNSVNIMKRRSFNNTPIQEEDEDEDDPNQENDQFEEFDSQVWKNGYNVGFARGRTTGLQTGKTIGREEGIDEGYVRAIKEINNDSLSDESDREISKANLNETNTSIMKYKRGPAGQELIKSTKELTKFAEFKFSKIKPAVVKAPSPAHEIVKNLLKKSKEIMEKKAKAGKKMVNKIISNTLSAAISKNSLGSPEELLEICYDEFSQRYGLKKVIDRKFMEFLASLLKVKTYRRPFMFIKLSGVGKLIRVEGYSKFTLNLYLSSLNYMLTSKIGITMNYEETDDKNLFPINRAAECLREKLEGLLDRASINLLVSTVEGKAIPDPQRISTGLIELEYVLEVISDAYESQQKKITKGAKTLFQALGYPENSPVLQYDFCVAVRFICPAKFNRLESEEIVTQEVSFEDLVEICIEMNVLSENDLNNFVKNYLKKPFENFEELLGIAKKIDRKGSNCICIDKENWINRLERSHKELDPDSFSALVAWKLFECELRRIESEL